MLLVNIIPPCDLVVMVNTPPLCPCRCVRVAGAETDGGGGAGSRLYTEDGSGGWGEVTRPYNQTFIPLREPVKKKWKIHT